MRRGLRRFAVAASALAALGGLALALSAQGSVAASAGQHRATTQPSGANRARFTKTLVGYLRRRGFQVNSGYPILYAKDAAATCRHYTFPALNTCFGANPAAPYVIPVVKSWPNEYVDQRMVNTFGRLRAGYTPTYRLDPREAVVIYGEMPPPGRYFGVQTWEWSQRGHWKAKDYYKWAHDPRNPLPMSILFSAMPPPDPQSDRVWSFSALGDNINNVVIQRRSGYAFGKNRYFIITPSATTDRAVRHALQAQGVPNNYIFTEEVPSRDRYGRIGPLGMGKNAIDFNTFFRYAIPASADAAKAWRSQLPLTVMRVRPPAASQTVPAFTAATPVARYGPMIAGRRTAHSEAYLAGDLENLVNAVCSRASSTLSLRSADCVQAPPASSFFVDTVRGLDDGNWTGPYCRHINMNCDGDNSDTAFFYSFPFPLDSGQVYAVIDTLATETRNATYVGMSVNDYASLFTPSNVLDTTLKGSANSYANTAKNTSKLFVHYYARDCAPMKELLGSRPEDCTSITTDMVPKRGSPGALGDPALQGMFFLGIRDYVLPGSHLGPESSKLLKPRILAFTKP